MTNHPEHTSADHPPALALSFGTRMLLQPEGLQDNLQTMFIGLDKPRFLIVKAPPSKSFSEHIYPEKPVTVRYANQGTVFGFHSMVLSQVNKPAKLIFLVYPAKVETVNLRRNERVETHIPATFILKQASHESLIVNLSLGGCRLLIKGGSSTCSDLSKDGLAELVFALPGFQGRIRTGIRIRNLSIDDEKIFLGCQFEDLSQDSGEVIQDFVQTLSSFDEPARKAM
jgi:c-di-GMP-binding flagellar brake protein YcgR